MQSSQGKPKGDQLKLATTFVSLFKTSEHELAAEVGVQLVQPPKVWPAAGVSVSTIEVPMPNRAPQVLLGQSIPGGELTIAPDPDGPLSVTVNTACEQLGLVESFTATVA